MTKNTQKNTAIGIGSLLIGFGAGSGFLLNYIPNAPIIGIMSIIIGGVILAIVSK